MRLIKQKYTLSNMDNLVLFGLNSLCCFLRGHVPIISFDIATATYYIYIIYTVFIRLIAARTIRIRPEKSGCASLFGCVYY